jgi:hypothetical protein
LKNLKTSDRREGRQLGKVKSCKNRVKNNARHEKLSNQHPAVVPGWSGALGSLRNGGEEEQGYSEGLLEASHAGMGTGIGKIKMWWG